MVNVARIGRFDTSPQRLFAYLMHPASVARLAPPWETVRAVEAQSPGDGVARVLLDVSRGRRRRVLQWHCTVARPATEQRVEVRGDGGMYELVRQLAVDIDGRTGLTDTLRSKGPPRGLTARRAARLLAWQHQRLAADLRRLPDPPAAPPRVAISGASGLIGGHVANFLELAGHTVVPLVRRPVTDGTAIHWDPQRGTIDAAALEGVDAVIHLAGVNVAAGRWTARLKQAIRDSRVLGTRLLSETLAGLQRRPRVLIAASATGYYGDCGATPVDERQPAGRGFLAEVCQEWEAAAVPAAAAGIRVVHMRLGVVLSRRGGALARMLGPFGWGVGGVLGSGRQYLSWIALDDVVGLLHFLLDREVAGPVNATAPAPVTNREFTKTLGRVLRRPTVLPVPALVLRLGLGEMGQRLLLEGAAVKPARALEAGFRFEHPELEGALRAELGLVE